MFSLAIQGIVEVAVGAGHTAGPAIGGALYEVSSCRQQVILGSRLHLAAADYLLLHILIRFGIIKMMILNLQVNLISILKVY